MASRFLHDPKYALMYGLLALLLLLSGGLLFREAGVSVEEISEEKDGNFHKIHVVGTGSFSQIVRGFDIIKSKEVWNAVKLVRLKREGTVLSFAIEITAFQSRGTYEEEKYRTDRSDGDR